MNRTEIINRLIEKNNYKNYWGQCILENVLACANNNNNANCIYRDGIFG